jgi:hypothetical protein
MFCMNKPSIYIYMCDWFYFIASHYLHVIFKCTVKYLKHSFEHKKAILSVYCHGNIETL